MADWVADQIEKQVFHVDEEWSQEDEREKQNVLDEVFKQRPLALRKARRGMDALQDAREEDADVIGYLYWLAYNTVNAAVNYARVNDDSSREKLEELEEEFRETLKTDEIEITPYELKKLSREAKKINRTPARLRRLMEERGERIQHLIGFAYAGTEAVRDGAGGEEEMSMTDER
ncbi:hypothetical protein [Natrinema altunense]|uniref:Uncharacterized protein n=1 Tax=Natrinema altunense (strain JCM 12890 / CGMCC 1.3731 / AJ2) TaxID=1227494 RepID=L9ZER2_NATA2|nr:hypothetical protein [Natrinema altunense]ELY83678.1 hypothetical protein C485_18037 [Natrinema altunense JCM 12890]